MKKVKLFTGRTKELCTDFDYDISNGEIIISLFENFHYVDEIHLSEENFQEIINNYRIAIQK